MGVSIREVIEAGGYNINNPDDATWLLSKRQEFDELVEQAENVLYQKEERHSRWDAEHREKCGECHQEWLDEMLDMEDDARLDRLSN